MQEARHGKDGDLLPCEKQEVGAAFLPRRREVNTLQTHAVSETLQRPLFPLYFHGGQPGVGLLPSAEGGRRGPYWKEAVGLIDLKSLFQP